MSGPWRGLGAGFEEPTKIQVGVGGAWKTVSDAWVGKSGAWVKSYSSGSWLLDGSGWDEWTTIYYPWPPPYTGRTYLEELKSGGVPFAPPMYANGQTDAGSNNNTAGAFAGASRSSPPPWPPSAVGWNGYGVGAYFAEIDFGENRSITRYRIGSPSWGGYPAYCFGPMGWNLYGISDGDYPTLNLIDTQAGHTTSEWIAASGQMDIALAAAEIYRWFRFVITETSGYPPLLCGCDFFGG